MFEHHFGLRENPFPAGHQLKFVYPSREHQEARAHLRYGIENREPFLLITGEVGTGKTTSLYDALNEWGDRVAVALITNSALTRQELIEEICLRFGLQLPSGVSKPAALVALEKHLITVRARGEYAVLMMDEAQNLSMELLEEIRLLSNLEHKGEKLLQVFLVGQPELETHLGRHELRQLRQRITVHYRLNPLSPDETLGYIHHHINVAGGNGAIVFPSDTCREIFRLTHGIPREINTLASAALIAAYADGSPSVTLAHLASVAMEGDFRSVVSSPAPRPIESTPAPQAVTPPPAAPRTPTMPLPPAAPAAQQPAIPPNWPFPQAVPQSPLTPAAPAAPAPAAQSPYAMPPQPRGESNPGLLAAMRRAEAAPPAAPMPPAPPVMMPPQAPPAQRPAYATAPVPTAPGMPPRSAAPAPPATPPPPPPIPLPVQRVVPQPTANEGPSQPDLSGLSPRLRERLEREMAREEQGPSPVRNLLIAVSVIAVLGVMLVLMQRFGAIDVPFLRAAAGGGVHASQNDLNVGESDLVQTSPDADRNQVLIDSLRREADRAKRDTAVQTASTHVGSVRATSKATDAFQPSTETPTPAGTPDAAAPAPSAPAQQFGISAGSFTDSGAANTERDRLARSTTLEAQVVTTNDNGTLRYYVVLGRFTTPREAENTSNILLQNNMIGEGRVVSFPKR